MYACKILIVGGGIGRRHQRIANQLLPNAQVYLLSEHSYTGSPNELTDLGQAISFEPDIVVIANPASSHISTLCNFSHLENVFFLVEKPISNSYIEAKNLSQSEFKYSNILVGYNLRYLKAMQIFRELIALNNYGKILQVDSSVSTYMPDWRPGKNYSQTVSGSRRLGGGVLLELSHEIDYLEWLFGPLTLVSSVVDRVSNLKIDVEDFVNVIFSIENSTASKYYITLNMNFYARPYSRKCLVTCEGGSIELDLANNSVSSYEPKVGEWRVHYQGEKNLEDSYVNQWKHLIDCRFGGATPLVSYENGLRVLNLIDQIKNNEKK